MIHVPKKSPFGNSRVYNHNIDLFFGKQPQNYLVMNVHYSFQKTKMNIVLLYIKNDKVLTDICEI